MPTALVTSGDRRRGSRTSWCSRSLGSRRRRGWAGVRPGPTCIRGVFLRGKEEEYRGKKHIDPHHIGLSDETKREEGRYGKRRVQGFSGGCKDTVFSLLGGSDNGAPPEPNRVKPLSKHSSTSVQVAEARVLDIARNPSYAEAAREVLRHAGNPSIVREEERLSRRIAAVEYAKGSRARCAALQEQHKAVDLGTPGDKIQVQVPFALDQSAPRPDNVPEHRGVHYRNAESSPQPEKPARRCGGAAQHRGLRDHVQLSQNEYPDPPAVGVRTVPRISTRPSSSQQRSSACLDEEMLRRSRARCHQSASQRMPDFIFGRPPPPEAPHKTLRGITEERWKKEETRAAERRTGRAMTHQSHKVTALW
ncbi:uncharacterized protein Tco025E_04261 [Trypanosoma conorhini]|uniref:Uncharacterized protein n=1 Tax=Trypanosoma conorhini TaxID=83891 RepID=A0A422PMS5_9TRYP|nr:uncharacterized protein Tco025E_04261 [Trypanosoma conorhini]RNF19014.1 hypothetical protein Tco025E_04261 [Trypanosoma conorhini]